MPERIAGRTDWSAICGVLLCLSWAPMAIAIPRLPDLGSAVEVQQFWEDNLSLMQAVIASVWILTVSLWWLAHQGDSHSQPSSSEAVRRAEPTVKTASEPDGSRARHV